MLKKIVPVIIIIAFVLTILGACESYKYGPVGGGDKDATVIDNGGLAVKQGEWLYFINGYSDYDAEDPKTNFFGNVLKGAVMRGKIDADNNLTDVKVVVPKKVMSSSKDHGIYVFGDWIYYVSPGTGTDNKGNVLTDYIDFFRTSIDGTKTQKITTIKGNTTRFKFTKDAFVYYQDNKLISIDLTNKKFKETTIDEEVTSVLFPNNPVYNPASPESPADYIFYVKNPEDETEYHNEVYVVNSNGSGKKKLIDNKTYTAGGDLENIFTTSLLSSSVTDNKLAVYYTKKSVASVENQDRGLFGYEFDGTEFNFDKADEKCFSLKTATKIFPVSYDKGVFIMDSAPYILAKHTGEKTVYDFPSDIIILGIAPISGRDYVYYLNSNKVNRFPLDKQENAVVLIKDPIKTEWAGPDFIDGNMYYINTAELNYGYTFMADLTSYDLEDSSKFVNAMIGKMTQDDIKAKEEAEKEEE
jgi:hypothetical protein